MAKKKKTGRKKVTRQKTGGQTRSGSDWFDEQVNRIKSGQNSEQEQVASVETTQEKTQMSATQESARDDFSMSRWTIRIKLMVIISGLILLSLGAMIALATYFFRAYNILTVQENNLNLSRVISTNLESTIETVSRDVRLVAKVLDKYPQSRQTLENEIFGSEEDLIFLGIYRRAGNQLEPERRLVNPDLLVKYEILSADIYGLTGKYSESFMRTFSGQTVLINASPGFKTPIVGLGIPFEESGGQRTILVAYLKMDLFLENFQMSGITETFMVNQDGIVVAHPDNNVVLSSADASNMEIVRHMQTSPVNNGLLRYENDDGHSYLGSFNKLDTLGVGIISTVPEDKALEEVYNIQRRNLYLTIIIVSLALIVVFFFSKQISQPILILVRAARQIASGNFALNLVPEHRDELGLLTNSFNHMARGLQERANLKDSFGKFVNKELAELSMAGAISLGGERKECAIFFSDIRGFTALSERLRPEEVVEFLNEYFTDMVRCVNETHGIVDKFIGDAIMAHWGALKTYGNNTENAINAALMMRAALIAFNRGRGTARRPVLHMGCGINTGHVIAGQIGSDERLEYTVIGDAVNLASRVEALTKHFGVDIIVTNHSLDLVRGLYHAVEMDKMRVKGKAKPITVYAVLGRQDDPDCPKDLKELRRIVGIDYKPSAGKKAGEEVKYEPA